MIMVCTLIMLIQMRSWYKVSGPQCLGYVYETLVSFLFPPHPPFPFFIRPLITCTNKGWLVKCDGVCKYRITNRWNCFSRAFTGHFENYIVLVKTCKWRSHWTSVRICPRKFRAIMLVGGCPVWNPGLLYMLLRSHLWRSQHKFLTMAACFSHCLDTPVGVEGAVLTWFQSVTSQFLCCHLLRVDGT